jgi:PKD repeat protein
MFQYEWSVTDGGIITGGGTQTSSSVTVTWKEAGEQFVSVNYKNSNGCTALTPKILPVMVNERPQPMFSYTQELCNDTIHFSEFSLPANGSNNGWQWKFGDGSPQILITSPPKLNGDTSHAYSSSGYYRVTLMTKNMNGCWDTASMQIHKSHCIHASFSKEPDSLYCQYSTVIFTDSSTPVQMIDQWKWSFGDNTIRTYTSHRDTLHHTYNAPGTYTISLVVSASSGGLPIYDTMNQLITVGPSPIAKFQVDPVCQDDSSQFINLSDSNGVILTYRMWNFGDPGSGTSDTSSLANPVHYYKSPGKYIATLTLGNIYGCESTCTHEVKILLRPKADFEYTKPCSGTEIELADNSLPGDTIIDKWKWHLGDPVYPYDTLHTPIVQYTYDVPGLYEIYLKVMDKNNCSDTIHQFLEIIPSPLSLFTIKESANGQPGNIQLQNESTGATNILWDFGNGKTSILENPIVTYEEDGSYTITLITWNEAGCYDTTFMKYEFMFHNLYVANAFYPESAIPLVRLFLPIGTNLKKYHLMIFDKWGHTLFESTMLDNGCGCPIEGWNGIFQGVMMPQDTYIWKIEAVFKDDKVWEGSDPGTGEISTMGTVTLIR